MARKKGGSAAGPPPVAGWLATYGDMVTNMLCFFVLLLSFSNTDATKFRELSAALQGVLSGAGNILPNQGGLLSSTPIETSTSSNESNQVSSSVSSNTAPSVNYSLPSSNVAALLYGINVEELYADGSLTAEGLAALEQMQEQALQEQLLQQQQQEHMEELIADLRESLDIQDALQGVELKPNERGVIVRFADTVLFDAGSATLRPEALVALSALLEPIRAINNVIIIEGHTCDLPINNMEFSDNWDLSAGRALSVLRYFLNQGIDPQRLRAVPYGEYQNIVPNISEENRQRNRRVDIVIMNDQ